MDETRGSRTALRWTIGHVASEGEDTVVLLCVQDPSVQPVAVTPQLLDSLMERSRQMCQETDKQAGHLAVAYAAHFTNLKPEPFPPLLSPPRCPPFAHFLFPSYSPSAHPLSSPPSIPSMHCCTYAPPLAAFAPLFVAFSFPEICPSPIHPPVHLPPPHPQLYPYPSTPKLTPLSYIFLSTLPPTPLSLRPLFPPQHVDRQPGQLLCSVCAVPGAGGAHGARGGADAPAVQPPAPHRDRA
ncbi:unnamed protein product [Closterium sp. Naga37s-1]|nr:unnamed protein product [Closterium sp. Naga37s-1]